MINELFICVLEMLRHRTVSRLQSLATAERSVEIFLEELRHTTHLPWTLDAMAEATGLKRTRFAHYCRKLTNLTPRQLLNTLRVEQAVELITGEPGRSLTDIAFACGFSSSQYFATVFRQQTGLSPRAYRAARAGQSATAG
jgi:AraC family L-rhamnose operon regulatory protein RhaS